MIQYNTKNWLQTLLMIFISLTRGKNYRKLLLGLIITGVYSFAATWFGLKIINWQMSSSSMMFTLLGFILSLNLVFRLNSSYNKWWEARTAWGSLVNNSRALAIHLRAVIPEGNDELKGWFAAQISNFTFALAGHLRDEKDIKNLIATDLSGEDISFQESDVPNEIAAQIAEKVNLLVKDKMLSEEDKWNAKKHIDTLIDVKGICERIKNTPIPFSHASFFKFFILVYLFALPFGLMDAFEFYTVPICLLMGFALLGIEIISEEIEEPFGYDPNDLPLHAISTKIRLSVFGIFKIALPENQRAGNSEVKGYFQIVH